MKKLILFFFYAYLVLFPLAQLIRVPPQSTLLSEVHFYLTDVAAALMLIFWIGRKLIARERFKSFLSKPVFLFFAICLFSLLINIPLLTAKHAGISSLYLIRWIVYASIYFVVFDLKKSIDIKKLLIMVGIASSIIGLFQYFSIPDTRFLERYGWDPHYYRLIGTFLDPGYLGAILVLTLVLLTDRFWNMKPLNWKNILVWIIVYLAFALTYSRASYLAFLAAMAVIAYIKKSPKFFLTTFLLLLVTIPLLPRPGGEGVRLERDSTIKFRIINWQNAVNIIKDHPILGVGFNSYRYAQEKYGYLVIKINEEESHSGAGVDSSFLFVLATTGILGIASYLWLWKKSLELGGMAILASGAALIIHSFFTNTLFYPWIMGWWWILLGTTNSEKPEV